MCGVVSILYGEQTEFLGREASDLLKKLEYRGYDSTGGAFISDDGAVILRKKVGAPSRVIEKLEIDRLPGKRFIGQVRWATYGSVTDQNAQPHEVSCRAHLVGAHNGNISNTDALKEFLTHHGHTVLSDNDGEMLVHLVEHHYAIRTAGKGLGEKERIAAMKDAIRTAQRTVQGSYAACVTAPDLPGVFAMKSGSSLYAGKGTDSIGDFIVVSSDLTSVLSKTRFLIPLAEGEGLHFLHDAYTVFSLSEEREHVPDLVRSRLNIADVSLQPRYSFFMEQEISSSPRNLETLLRYYFLRPEEQPFHSAFEAHEASCREFLYGFLKLGALFDRKQLLAEFHGLVQGTHFSALYDELGGLINPDRTTYEFTSEDAALLEEIAAAAPREFRRLALIDMMLVWKKKRTVLKQRDRLVDLLKEKKRGGGHIFIVASGTSYHAALTAGYFFNDRAGLPVFPANPGMFRSLYLNGLTDKDIIIGVSQSGETKDLVDIFNDVKARYGDAVLLVSLVNNENSTLPQEKSAFYLPILCGPEIAVAATKSFISQIALFHLLADLVRADGAVARDNIEKIVYHLDFTLKNLDPAVTAVANRWFLKPSMHILGTSLIGLAREGALKVREVVLNHTEGYDAAEFKHGPNTILGDNTIFSLADMERLHGALLESFDKLAGAGATGPDSAAFNAYLNMLRNIRFRFGDIPATERLGCSPAAGDILRRHFALHRERTALPNFFSNYPLLFVCPPDERDIRITISQIHTHKIRGADIVLIAEENGALRKAVFGRPTGLDQYYAEYIAVPATGDRNLFTFEAAAILQTLAFKMSVEKMKYLNRNRIENHGVHPDVPKNVSKSITVD